MENKSAYLIGIKGVGMTALALYLKQAGFEVTGSDNDAVYITDQILKDANIKIFEGFSEENVQNINPSYVVVSAAYGLDNPEVKTSEQRRLNVLYYSQMLGKISADKQTIAVAGVHGKTTTTALLSLLLIEAKLDPSFIIGAAKVADLKNPAQKGEGEYFVVEADEYRQSPSNNASKFLDLTPVVAVISSIEFDHPDIFKTVEDVYQTFYRFACRVPRHGRVILCLDYPKCRKLKNSLVDRTFETYGFSDDAAWKIVDVSADQMEFSLEHNGLVSGPFKLNIPGRHNILNATVAVILADILNIDETIVKKVLSEFSGAGRRFEKISEVNGVQIYDDYAHHPTAIAHTLEAARAKFSGSKIFCVFQPHTFSRTESLLKEFGHAFQAADSVLVTDIYASARESEGKIIARDLVKEIKNNAPANQTVLYFQTQDEIKKYLLDTVKAPAVIFTMGAGDIYKIGPQIAEEFKA